MEWWHIYLFTRLDVVKNFFEICLIVTFVGAAIGNVMYVGPICELEIPEEHMPIFKKINLIVFLAVFVLTFFCIAIPTQKEMAAIYLLPKLANSEFKEEVSKIPTNALKVFGLKLEGWIEDLDKPKENKGN